MFLSPLLSGILSMLSLLLVLFSDSADSCSSVSLSNETLTGVCPNDTFTVPVGVTLTYECSYNITSGYYVYWDVNSGTILTASSSDKPPGISDYMFSAGKTTMTILTEETNTISIQCGLCKVGPGGDCVNSPKRFIGEEVVTFGPPSLLSHELRENGTVKLSWSAPALPPSDVSLFTYNIIIMESTNNSLTVTNINITNNTYVIISSANITGYNECTCTSYQWGVRAAANISYGFTDITMANDTFTFFSAPNITDAMVTGNISSIIFELIFSTPTEDAYTYTLHQRDYCGDQLNSTEISNTLINVTNDTMVSINIQSLILDVTWSVSVEVSVCQYNDTTQYINITNGNDTDRILDCKSDSLMSSTATTSITTLLSSISSMGPTSFLLSSSPSPSSSVTNTPSGTAVSGKSINIAIIIGGIIGGVLVLLIILIAAVLIVCKIKKKGSYDTTSKREDEGNDDNVKSFKPDIEDNTDERESPTANRSASADGIEESTDVSNEGYEPQIHLPGGNPDPTYQDPVHALSQVKSAVPPTLNYAEPMAKPQEYSSPIKAPSSFAPQRSDAKPPINIELVDMPGYTVVPAHMKKSTGSKKKPETKNQKDPLPPAPNDTEGTPDSELPTHQYADLDEIRSRKTPAPPPTVLNDVKYSQVIQS